MLCIITLDTQCLIHVHKFRTQQYYFLHFTDGNNEAQIGQVVCSNTCN